MGVDARPAEAPPIAEAPVSEGTAPGGVAKKAEEGDKQFWLALSHRQVQELVQQEAASRGGGRGLLGVVLALNGASAPIDLDELTRDQRYHDRRISQSVIRGLLVLSAFSSGDAHGVKNVAKQLGIGTTTTWRYLKTWVTLGVLEERKDRRYQLARRWIDELPQTVLSGDVVGSAQ